MRPGWRRFSLVWLVASLLAGCSKTDELARLTGEAAQAEKRGEHEVAIARWTAALRLAPKNRQAYLQRAALYEVRGNWNNATADYTEYLRLSTNGSHLKKTFSAVMGRKAADDTAPERSLALCRRGFILAKQGNFEKGLADLKEAYRLDPDGPFTVLCRAQIYALSGDAEKALAWFTKAIQVSPSDANAYTQRGRFYTWRGKIKEATTDLDEAVRLDPQNGPALTTRALANSLQGETDKALQDLDAAVKASPEDPEIYAARGGILLDQGDYQAAFDDFNETLFLRPHDPLMLARRGLAWSHKGNIEQALVDLNEAIRLNPAEGWLYALRGMALNETNQFERAWADLNHAVQCNTNETYFYICRGTIQSKRQEYDLAVIDFGQAMRLNQGNAEAYNSLAWFRATCPADSFRDGKEAVRLATRACELTGFKRHGLLDTLAAAYAETGDFEQAIAYEKTALGFTPARNKKRPAKEERLSLYQQHKPFREKANP